MRFGIYDFWIFYLQEKEKTTREKIEFSDGNEIDVKY